MWFLWAFLTSQLELYRNFIYWTFNSYVSDSCTFTYVSCRNANMEIYKMCLKR